MKNPKVGALLVILVLLLVFVVPTIWKNTIGKPEKNPQQTTVVEEKCKGGPATIDHGTVLAWGKQADYPRKGEMVTFEGYVQLPNMTFENSGTYLIRLAHDSTLEDHHLTMMLWEGDCENTMMPIPNDYEESDLLIHDNNGKEIVHGDKVRVTGKVRDDAGLYTFFVKRIEKI